tara:strand:- start:2252 stop:4021 length:1770 start_codon:yes stop_codon:yes gene_type:complete
MSNKNNNKAGNSSNSKNNSKNSTSGNLKDKLLGNIENLSVNRNLIMISFFLIITILFFYYNSMSYKVNQSLKKISKYRSFVVTGSELNKTSNRNRKLCDFYVASAFRPYMTKNQYLEYCSLEIFEEILKTGVRSVYIDVFNSYMGEDAEPIITNGFESGEWKLTLNTLKLEDVLKLINRVVFSSGFVNNFNDPFILCLNLKTNSNVKCLNKVATALHQTFGNRLLDNNYTYASKHIMTTKIKELMGKVIVFASGGFKNSNLEEFVNYSWETMGLKKISYESVDASLENTNVVKLDTEELKNFNKNGITLVTPDENTFFTYNFNPDFGWDSGCQLVFLNYQNVDENMNTYIEKFQVESFVKKPQNMISTSDFNQSVRMKVSEAEKSKEENAEEKLSCPEKPNENYDANFGSSMIFYKEKGSENLGLCYGVGKGQRCNCDKSVEPKGTCNDSLWIKYNLTDDFDVCCSSKRINNPFSNCDANGLNCKTPPKFYFSNKNSNLCTNGTKLNNVVLQNGMNNFNRKNKDDGSGDYHSSEMYKCDINNSDDITDRKICLLDKNDRDNCPQGWDFTGKFDSETYNGQSINICCKNT